MHNIILLKFILYTCTSYIILNKIYYALFNWTHCLYVYTYKCFVYRFQKYVIYKHTRHFNKYNTTV